ncbi:glycosyltransferase [Halobaculum limi]|uniref:glycosyltransferase n=1 Tax=Halobaculum limi TaxID=3031916 RepID=UPI002405C92C|nr:glycosyltransferase [Halobaculum sp. YSMS11]
MALDTVSVSIIVPVYNDATGIAQTIESLLKLNHTPAEILIIDNNSTDNTRDVIRQSAGNHDHIQLLVEDQVQGSYAARNRGIEYATGDVLVFLDADETVTSDWLGAAVRALIDQDVDYLGCNVELTLGQHTYVGKYNVRTGFPIKEYIQKQHYAPTCALLVRKQVFNQIGSFDSRLISGGDKEFGERAYEAGYKQGYTDSATVYHPARTQFKSLAKKNIRVGRGFCQLQRHYPERYGNPGIPPRPEGPTTSSGNGKEPTSTQVVFFVLSIVMLAFRGFGYYYEFISSRKTD